MLFSGSRDTEKPVNEYSTSCDLCSQEYFHPERGANRKKSGHPVYLVCRRCYDWSLPRSERDKTSIMKGSVAKQETTGNSFSNHWTGAYMAVKSTLIGGDDKKEKDESEEKVDNENDEDSENKGILSTVSETITQDVKAAVNIIESGITGLVSGAADALGITKKHDDDKSTESE